MKSLNILLLISLLLAAFTGTLGQEAEHLGRPAIEDLDKDFINPTHSAKPLVYWWWLYNRVNKESITRDLEEFKAKGIGGVNLICTGGFAGDKPHLGVEFLGPEWRELFRHAVREAKRLNIEMGFNLGGSWVMNGPWVTPDQAMKKFVQTYEKVSGPGKTTLRLKQPLAVANYYRDVCVQAFRVEADQSLDPRSVVDLTGRIKVEGEDGLLDWDAPEGKWLVFRSGYTITGSRQVAYPPGDVPRGGDGYQIDYLRAAALDDHFNYIGKIVLEEAARAGGKLAYLWSDSWECGKFNWTQDFPAQFRKFRGYDLKPYLPALTGHIVGNTDISARFRIDFDRSLGDCLAENFYGHFAGLCHKNGMEMRSEAAGPGNVPPWDSPGNLGRCDVPAGEFWAEGLYKFDGGYNLNLKQTASAAHTYGLKRTQAEAFTQQSAKNTHWANGPSDLKPIGDLAFCEGINLFMLHAATCQLPSDGLPGYEFCAGQHWAPNNTWWPQAGSFFTYLSRCQYMLQQGIFVGDICYFLGEGPPIVAPPKQPDDPDYCRGYDSDYCNAEVLIKRMSVKNGRIVLPDGMSYSLLVLQNCTTPNQVVAGKMGSMLGLRINTAPTRAISVEVARKIRELVRDGATVVGAPPEKAIGLKDYVSRDVEVKAIASEVWGDCDGKTQTEHIYGKGSVIWGKTTREVLLAKGILPDFTCPDEVRGSLDYIHRSTEKTDIYFLFNRENSEKKAVCTFRLKDKRPELWDPNSGSMRELPEYVVKEDGRIEVPLEFARCGSFFVIFRNPIGSPAKTMLNFPTLTPFQNISGPWEVRFDTKWGGPASVEFPELVSWTKYAENGIKYYSGKATYHKIFYLPIEEKAKKHGRFFIDFGNIRHIAEVRLNGKI